MHHPLTLRTGPLRRTVRTLFLVLLSVALMVTAVAGCASAQPQGGVQILTVDGMINPVIANYIERGIEQAERSSAEAVVIQLDTPGGLDTSMREIVQTITSATVPVVVYVAPAGARAASAGTFVTMAAHVAAMAPATAIGAAHPVMAGGEDIPGDDLRTKAENDAAAYIRSIAESRGRNADWAESAVRVSASVSGSEAVALNVVDLQARSLDELLLAIDGREVTLATGLVVSLETAAVARHENPMTLSERFLMHLSNPNIAFLLLTIGSLALILELYNPTGVGLVVGGLALTVAFFSLGTLPVNWAGVALIALAVALFVAELLIVSGGLLALTGAVTLALGALFLTTSNQPAFEVSRWIAFGVPAVIGLSVAAMATFLLRLRKRVPTVGPEALVGSSGVALSTLEPGQPGHVLMQGERWRAELDSGSETPVAPGERAEVTGVRGLLLLVRGTGPGDQKRAASDP
jgi:membrane-bound serine protease (ClpP class)